MAYTTETTVIAAFKNPNEAQSAAQELQSAGIPKGNIFLESASAPDSGLNAHSGEYATRSTHHEGGVSGWFKSLFQGDDNNERGGYEKAMSSGNFLLSVDAPEEQVSSIEEILHRYHPVNVHTDGHAQQTASSSGTSAFDRETKLPASETGSVPVVEEELQVGKRRVLSGGVRVYSRMVETPVQESIELQEEHVHVNRSKVDRPASEADLASGREHVIEVEEFADQPVVSKQARVIEEVSVGKETTERTENIQDTVRHTEVTVEPVSLKSSH